MSSLKNSLSEKKLGKIQVKKKLTPAIPLSELENSFDDNNNN